MSLTLLVVIVVAGIAGVVAAVHLTGGSALARLADEAAALERFARDFPDLRVRSVHRTQGGDAAFLALDDGRVGVVAAVGGKFLTRVVAGSDLAGAPRASRATVAMRLRDFTWPGGIFSFADAEQAEAVTAMFAALRGSGLRETQ